MIFRLIVFDHKDNEIEDNFLVFVIHLEVVYVCLCTLYLIIRNILNMVN